MLRRESSLQFQPEFSNPPDETSLHNLQIPAPPLPEAVDKGFTSQDYWHLIYSLSEEKRKRYSTNLRVV